MISFVTFENSFLFGYVEVICFESFEHPISPWFDEMICFEIPEYQFWSHFPISQIIFATDDTSIIPVLEINIVRHMQDPRNFLNACKARKNPRPTHLTRIRDVEKVPLDSAEPPKGVPLAWLACSSPRLACYQVNKEAIQAGNQIEGNSAIFNPITRLPKCLQLLNAKI